MELILRAAGCYQSLSMTHIDVTAADDASQRCSVNTVSTDTHQCLSQGNSVYPVYLIDLQLLYSLKMYILKFTEFT